MLATPSPELSKADVRNILYGLMLGMFLSALNQTIVATALPTIGREFGDFENLSWVIIAYLLSSTVVSPLYGKLSDIHGRRGMMLLAIGLFVAGSALCAAAPNMAILIAGRTLQGIGGGGIVPLTQTTIADMITPRERGRYQAYMGTSWIVAGVAGPVLGGAIAEYLYWPLIFWINVPLGLFAALLTYHAMKRLPRHELPHQLDLMGAALMVAAATMLLIAVTSGGSRMP
jgi:MFS family permease